MKFSEEDKRFAREAVREAERAREVLAATWGTPEARAQRAREAMRRRAYWDSLQAVGKRLRKQRERELAKAAANDPQEDH